MKGATVLTSPSSDPRPTPRPLVQCFKGEEPQMIITAAYYTVREARDDVFQ